MRLGRCCRVEVQSSASRAGMRSLHLHALSQLPQCHSYRSQQKQGVDLRLAAENARCDRQSKFDDLLLSCLQEGISLAGNLGSQANGLIRSLLFRFT